MVLLTQIRTPASPRAAVAAGFVLGFTGALLPAVLAAAVLRTQLPLVATALGLGGMVVIAVLLALAVGLAGAVAAAARIDRLT